ncbi:xanthine dehydrogenase family protein molybdopterin-binding subunit [Variovorax sp. N23]|uniref:xanthine dehydrogenase family protein molybdopterin-binding subunit n=1 Tax=Variovorax sp. N23 TaxID=2980555 RepID=UPI0021C73758|nr:xanthine dehydrogenase family protein molybdopterin-binding subunit [Variovorax sp. N23]MCU4119022.1 xanthine dehydrogenase family protein molybdopterin-binding subunit [Variovorax sp. N23]
MNPAQNQDPSGEKPPNDATLSLVGQAVPRADAIAKVTGSARYAADVQRAATLHAVGVRASIAKGTITRLSTRTAEDVPGVVAVYTHLDAARRIGWHPGAEAARLSAEELGLGALADGAERRLQAWRPLCTPDIHFGGQWIAVVVAESLEDARLGARCIEVGYDAQRVALALIQPGEQVLEPGFFFGEEMQVSAGMVPAPSSTVHRVEATYETPTQHHQPMEPTATLAFWEGDHVTVHDSTQGVGAARDYIAASLGVATEQVSVKSRFVGGGFGSKNQMWPHQALAAHLARALSRPVRLQLSRADMSVATGHRGETRQDVRLETDASGRFASVCHDTWTPTSLHGGFFEPCGLNTLALYPTAHLEVRHHVVRRPIPTPTPFRGPGETPGSFALESAVDELACQMGQDPIDFRVQNFPHRDALHDRDWSSIHLASCYEQGAKKFGWSVRAPQPRSRRQGHEWVGYGMATTAYPAPALPASVRVTLHASGYALIETDATDIGTGMATILVQVVATELALPSSAVKVAMADSDLPATPTAGRSKSTASVLPAAQAACTELRQKLAHRLAVTQVRPATEPRPDDMLAQLAFLRLPTVEATARSAGKPDTQALSFYSFGAHFVEVRIDEELARIRIARVVSSFDCGRIVNPLLAASQLKGGIVFGLGMALMEQTAFDPNVGRIINDNLADYHLPVNADVPDIEVLFVGEPDLRFNALGVRGLGEIGVPGVAAAVANAVFNAVGRRVRRLPISARDLLPAK